MFDLNASLNDDAPLSPILLAVYLMRLERSGLLMNAICVLFLLYLPQRSSFVSVVFDFNASLNIVVSVSPILLPVDFMGTEKICLFMDAICVFL